MFLVICVLNNPLLILYVQITSTKCKQLLKRYIHLNHKSVEHETLLKSWDK